MTASEQPAINASVQKLAPPPIPAMQAQLKAYDGSNGPAIDLSQAVPGYAPHADLMRWLGETAATARFAGYGDIQGETPLREAFARDVNAAYGSQITADNVQITAGGNQAFFALMLAIAAPGDDIVLVRPFYFNHEMTLAMMGIRVQLVDGDAENGLMPSLQAIETAIGPRTRAVCVVTPNNPTGSVYPAGFLDRLDQLCREKGVFLVADETYRDFLPAESGPPHALLAKPNWESNFIHLYSFSKVFCIPGYRLGAIVCGERIMTQLQKVMDNLQICAPRAAQHAIAQALPALTNWRRQNQAIIEERRVAFQSAIGEVGGWEIVSIGAYFAYLRHPNPDESATAVATRLAANNGILVLPGTCFGDNQSAYVRAAFANVDTAVIRSLVTRLPARL